MDERTKYRVPIGDACVSMRVCFDSLCFSSTEQRHADEEDAASAVPSLQLPPTHIGAAADVVTIVDSTVTTTQVTQVPHVGAVGGGVAIAAMDKDIQELLRLKDERIAELESMVCSRDAIILTLRSQLDKFLSVLPFSAAPPLTPTKPRIRGRAQGISAEPPRQELASLAVIDKSDRLVYYIYTHTHARTYIPCGSSLPRITRVCMYTFHASSSSLPAPCAPTLPVLEFPALKQTFLTCACV